MSKIDPTARVEDGAVIGEDASIGPYCVVGRDAVIGAQCKLVAHVFVEGHTTIGPRTVVYPFASLGTAPQSIGYKGEPTKLEIGADCTVRESVTMNRGTVEGGGVTKVGDKGYFMAYSHIAHDCQVGNGVIFANSAALGGHSVIGDHVFMGGLSAIHQHTRVGPQVMVGGGTGVLGDVIPYALVNGRRGMLEGLNVVGMRRRGFTAERLRAVRAFYHELFYGSGTFDQRLADAIAQPPQDPAITEILDFIRAGTKRRLTLARADIDPDVDGA
jgi:UDP-N-acetylglucosamine acyltransferase